MRKRYTAYLSYLRNLSQPAPDPELASRILVQIQFAQNERLIHLLVTLFFGLFEAIAFCVLVLTSNLGAGVFALLLLVLLVPYIFHYYFLENTVQEMYRYYDKYEGETFLEDTMKRK